MSEPIMTMSNGNVAAVTTSGPLSLTRDNPADVYTPPATQADLDKIIQDRLRRHKPDDYDDLMEKASRLDALEVELSSDKDRAVAAARDDALREANTRVVRAEFKAAGKGVLTPEQVNELLEDVDLAKFLDKKGDIDIAKIERKINAFAPKQETTSSRQSIGYGQGARERVAVSAREAGAAEAARRFGPKKTA